MKMETHFEKHSSLLLKILQVIHNIQLNYKSNLGNKKIHEWLTNNNGHTKILNDSFANDGFSSSLGLESSNI